MSVPGKATAENTRRYFEELKSSLPASSMRVLGRTKLMVSKIGFGTYRCRLDNPNHQEALKKALQNGCNVVDTSANYMNGEAESLIGEVLNELVVWQQRERSEFVIGSKVGYLQGDALQMAREREADGRAFPEVVKLNDHLWHCIHPKFIEDQLTRSLSHLQMDTMDYYLLHNPEYFFKQFRSQESIPVDDIRSEFYRRMQEAFVFLEKAADEGYIQFYGISSNTLVVPVDHPEYVSLESVWESYQGACRSLNKPVEEGHFAVVQLPLNWIEHGAYSLKNQPFEGHFYSALELTDKLQLGVLTNRPLNAIHQGRLYRLAKYPFRTDPSPEQRFQQSLEKLGGLEEEILQAIRHWKIDIPIANQATLSSLFQNSKNFRALQSQIDEPSQLEEVVAQFFLPQLEIASQAFLKEAPREHQERARAFMQAYSRHLQFAIRNLREWIHFRNYQRVRHLENLFDEKFPDIGKQLTLSQKALLVVSSFPGVDCVLNGMRHPDYVEDSLQTMFFDDIPVEEILPESLPGEVQE